MPRVDRQTGFHRSTSDRDTSPAPIRFPPDNFKHSLTLFSKSFSSFPRGTCSLSVSHQYLALDGIYSPIGAAFPNNPTRRQRLVVRQGPSTTGLSPSLAPPSRGLGPGPPLRTLLQTTIRTPKAIDSHDGLFPVRSSLLGESLGLGPGPPLRTLLQTTIRTPKAIDSHDGLFPAQLAFKDSMVHGILQFTPSIAFRYVLHRCKSRDIRCRESFHDITWRFQGKISLRVDQPKSIAFRYVLHRCESRDIRCRESFHDITWRFQGKISLRVDQPKRFTYGNLVTSDGLDDACAVCFGQGHDNDPSAGSPTETLLRLLLPLNDKVQWTSRDVGGGEPPPSPRSEHFTGPFNR
ncbi:hypothetical protein DEO72_LG9g1127 [Vigna unguiculata]|uniref:Uncharacterized protein n=1 Tax=Vigna unguiculata TaxID=3917 RepID=A0A4D6MXE7_VIGUN|nr:hypothetical protein DEO72_LG9g1127 [Vigna unguiculata]